MEVDFQIMFIINNYMVGVVRMVVLVVGFWGLELGMACGQRLDFLADSTRRVLEGVSEEVRDSLLVEIGEGYYAKGGPEGYGYALDCFNAGLVLAEKYGHKTMIYSHLHDIGSVYDVRLDAENTLYYYKRCYDAAVDVAEPRVVLGLTFDVAHAYLLAGDTVNAVFFLDKVKRNGELVYKSDALGRSQILLLVAFLNYEMHRISAFKSNFELVDNGIVYQNDRFPYRNYFAVCSWRYAMEKRDFGGAVDGMLRELGRVPVDSAYFIGFLEKSYVGAGNYEQAYRWSKWTLGFEERNLKLAAQKDLTVKLLKTENLLRKEEKDTRERERNMLFVGLMLMGMLAFVAAYFWRKNWRSRLELAERNAEKLVLINEIHHRVKNNLQLQYSLASGDLRGIGDEGARYLWQKHLSRLRTMSLVNEKLYNSAGVAEVVVVDFVGDILAHFAQIHALGKGRTGLKIEENLVVGADFAIPFGLILSELVTNSYKYRLVGGVAPRIVVEVFKGEGGLVFIYRDEGKSGKKKGGASLVRDLTRQLKGVLVVENEVCLVYRFVFE
jgi:two-component sensor histidine kinase